MTIKNCPDGKNVFIELLNNTKNPRVHELCDNIVKDAKLSFREAYKLDYEMIRAVSFFINLYNRSLHDPRPVQACVESFLND